MRLGRLLVACAPFLGFALAVACGDRTGLLVDDQALPSEAIADAGRDVRARDALADAIPGLDVVHDVNNKSDCPDADATLVYVITEQFELMSFYPPTLEFRTIGQIACPAAAGSTPFSMAVDRQGIARIVFSDGNLYRVSTATAACQRTTFQPGQHGFNTFGMGYVANVNTPGETLYVAADGLTGGVTQLASIDQNYVLHPVGAFSPQIAGAELTGTGGGQLFAFYKPTPTSTDSLIGNIDRQTAAVVGQFDLNLDQGQGWAFAFWGGDFWIFTAPGGSTAVTRYNPMDNSVKEVTRISSIIVGAGVSTCAPQQ